MDFKALAASVDKADVFLILGSILVVSGVTLLSRPAGLITAGTFLLAMPAIGIISAFIRGLRS
jgi:hypothetical protein